ncbi:MAG TPA: carboxypeptidase-like regulatory domain-containing protein [Oscillatoriaceae cyanobacterium]
MDPGTTLFSGTVDDETGTAVPSATVQITSLNDALPYNNTVSVTNGSYVVKGAPAGVALKVTVSKTGFTTRSRIVTLALPSQTQPNIVDFGGPANSEDPVGPSFFISDYPEIVSVTPLAQSTGNDPAGEAYSLTLSEPLDVTNQRRFESEIRIWPANAAAAPSANPAPSLLNGTPGANLLQSWPIASNFSSGNYAIAQAGSFGDFATGEIASVTFSADGLTATVNFSAPLLTSNTTAPMYQIGLVHPAGAAEVVDGNGHALGTDSTGAPGSAPTDASASLVYDAFENPALTGSTWGSTHTNVTWFELAKDTTVPTLTAVDCLVAGGDSRILLTFSKPMAAYGGDASTDGEYLSPKAADAKNYVFAFGKVSNDVANVDLSAGTPQTATSFAQVATGTPVVFAPSAVKIDVDPSMPSVVRLTASAANDELSPDLSAVKVRVAGAQDPAGNTIVDTNDSTSNVQTGSI